MLVQPFDSRSSAAIGSLVPECHALAVAADAVSAAWDPVDTVVVPAVLHRWLEIVIVVRAMVVEQNSAAHLLMVADFVVAAVDWLVDLVMVTVAVECQTKTVHISISIVKRKISYALPVMDIDCLLR